jgi:hypothetical protein
MGLDMYLNVRKYVSRVERWESGDPVESERFYDLVKVAGMEHLVSRDTVIGGYVEVPVHYWRKSNAIHKFFVDNYAEGVDNCQPIYIPRQGIEELVKRCDEILKDSTAASKLLPTEGGFFFGPTEYDEYYFGDLVETQEAMKQLLEKLQDDNDLIYQASW